MSSSVHILTPRAISDAVLPRLIEGGATLLVTLDCGTVSDEPIAHARGRGIDVLVIDHHLSDAELPAAAGTLAPLELAAVRIGDELVKIPDLEGLEQKLADAGLI